MDRDHWNAIWAGEGPRAHEHADHPAGHEPSPHRPDGASARSDARHRHGHGEPDRLLVDAVDRLPPGRALDLGCGLGANAIWLAAQGWQVRAVDFSDVAIEQARQMAVRAGVEVDFVVGDLRELELDERYDLVTSCYVHLPVADRQRLLERASQAVAPGGRLVFVGHDRSASAWFEQHVREGHPPRGERSAGHEPATAGSPDEGARDLLATLTRPEEIASELVGLVVERAEVVLHDPHGEGEEVGTTLVVARRGG